MMNKLVGLAIVAVWLAGASGWATTGTLMHRAVGPELTQTEYESPYAIYVYAGEDGDLLYYSVTSGTVVALNAGATSQVLTVGADGLPVWAASEGSDSVTTAAWADDAGALDGYDSGDFLTSDTTLGDLGYATPTPNPTSLDDLMEEGYASNPGALGNMIMMSDGPGWAEYDAWAVADFLATNFFDNDYLSSTTTLGDLGYVTPTPNPTSLDDLMATPDSAEPGFGGNLIMQDGTGLWREYYADDVQVGTATIALGGWPTPTPVPVAANPSASVNGTTTNGSAATFMRSDGAPALADPFTPADATQNITGTLSASVAVFGAQLQGYSALTNLLRPYTAASNLAFRLWNDSYGFDFQKTDGTSKAFLSATGDFQMDGALDVDGTSTSTIAGQVAVAGNVDVTSGVAAGTYFFLPQHAEPPAGQVRGALYYDTDDNKAKCWNGSGWQDLY